MITKVLFLGLIGCFNIAYASPMLRTPKEIKIENIGDLVFGGPLDAQRFINALDDCQGQNPNGPNTQHYSYQSGKFSSLTLNGKPYRITNGRQICDKAPGEDWICRSFNNIVFKSLDACQKNAISDNNIQTIQLTVQINDGWSYYPPDLNKGFQIGWDNSKDEVSVYTFANKSTVLVGHGKILSWFEP